MRETNDLSTASGPRIVGAPSQQLLALETVWLFTTSAATVLWSRLGPPDPLHTASPSQPDPRMGVLPTCNRKIERTSANYPEIVHWENTRTVLYTGNEGSPALPQTALFFSISLPSSHIVLPLHAHTVLSFPQTPALRATTPAKIRPIPD